MRSVSREELGLVIRQHLNSANVMQIATSVSNQPWVCSVYFVHDGKLNLYWLSYPDRRHSVEIACNSMVAATFVIKPDLPVIGLSVEGIAETINDATIVSEVMEKYIAKYDAGHGFIAYYQKGENKHAIYRLTPTTYTLFDEVNLPKDVSHRFDVTM